MKICIGEGSGEACILLGFRQLGTTELLPLPLFRFALLQNLSAAVTVLALGPGL